MYSVPKQYNYYCAFVSKISKLCDFSSDVSTFIWLWLNKTFLAGKYHAKYNVQSSVTNMHKYIYTCAAKLTCIREKDDSCKCSIFSLGTNESPVDVRCWYTRLTCSQDIYFSFFYKIHVAISKMIHVSTVDFT